MGFNMDSLPWITRKFVSCIKEHDHCYAHRVQTLQTITDAHHVRNRVANLKRNLQKVYCQNAIREAGQNSNTLGKNIMHGLKSY